MICPGCGGTDIITTYEIEKVPCQSLWLGMRESFEVIVPVRHCKCGFAFTDEGRDKVVAAAWERIQRTVKECCHWVGDCR